MLMDEEENEYVEPEAVATDLLQLPSLTDAEDEEETSSPPPQPKGTGKHNQVGTGKIRFSPADLKTLEGIASCIMSVTNSSNMVIMHKIEELKHTNMRDADLTRRQQDISWEEEEEISEENRKFIQEIKKEYILKNLMKTISMVPDLKNKICCIIFLMKRGAHVTYHDYFKLVPVETEFEYINQNNEWINAVIDDIFQDVFRNSQELDNVIAEFKARVDPEISQFLTDRYSDVGLLNVQTGTLYRAMNRHFGERFTKEDKQILGKFMSDYKALKNRSIVRDLQYYLDKFQLTKSEWTERMRDLKALKEINKLSAFDWLNIS